MSRFLLLILFVLSLVSSPLAYAQKDEFRKMPVYDALTQTPNWLNLSRPLTPDDLRGRIILIDFWTYCCINCIHVIPKLKALEHEFGDKLTVIGVHSAKFSNEGETQNIREAIQKYGIDHPVVNDADFRVWNTFGANAWPTIALIGPDGLLKQVYRGEGDLEAMRGDIAALIKKTGDKLVSGGLPLALEKNKIPPTVLRFPTKMDAKDESTMVLSDSGHNRIVIVDLKTNAIIETIGSGERGFKDGNFTEAQFDEPQGVLVDGDLIFVADTVNHRLRQIDLKTKQVTTLAGTGERGGYVIERGQDATYTALASPWDLAFYPDKNTIAIANAGTHQLWAYDRIKKTLSIIAGNGRESIDDGALPYNSLSQPSGLSVRDGNLYFADSETSSLRVFDGKTIKTLIGTGLFDFGLKDGDRDDALMQHAIGLYADSDAVYIADTYNHKIRKYVDGQLSTLAADGLKEPNEIQKVGDVLYIADTNNHRILRLNKDGTVTPLDIMPMKHGVTYQEQLPNLLNNGSEAAGVNSRVLIDLPKGWHINKDAPSYLALFDTQRNLVQEIKAGEIVAGKMALKGLELRKSYILQGILYYCEDKAGSQCLIRGVQTRMDVIDTDKSTVTITLPIK